MPLTKSLPSWTRFLPFWLMVLPSTVSGEGAPLFLRVGEQRWLEIPGLLRYSMSGTCVRYWRPPGRDQLLIKGLKPGTATLFIESARGPSQTRRIQIDPGLKPLHSPELLVALSQLHTTEVIDGGSRFILRGEISSRPEARVVAHLRDAFPGSILDETRIPPHEIQSLREQIQALVKSHPSLSLTLEEGEILVQGVLGNLTSALGLKKRIQEIHPLIRTEITGPGGPQSTLFFKVFLLEVNRERMNELGIRWPGLQPGVVQFNPLGTAFQSSIDISLRALTEKGIARILSSPELVVKAPGQAELFAGGEIPIRQRNRFNDSVLWKNFGLTLRIDVKEFGEESVRLLIETEISHLDSSLKQGEVPGLKTNRIKTLVDGTLGKPLLLSGLLQEGIEESSSGIPGLSEIPVLGTLFSSSDFRNRRSELVAILLPHRNPPDAPMNRISSELPRGYLPIPQRPISPEDLESEKNHPDYPWNVL